MSDNIDTHLELDLIACLEALLFVASGSVTASQLAFALQLSTQEVESGLEELSKRYLWANNKSGLRLEKHHGRYQLTTNPQAAQYIEHFLGLEVTSRLSRAALEALAIIAYQEPVTRPQIDSIRGVNSDGVLKSLLSKGLIQEIGRAESPGRPILYSTTADFLQHFGLSSTRDLPPLPDSTSEQESTDLASG
ncbi:MAG: SMC-Scp complex subunit ScpB [Anaerolineales bacterium]|nr:MAG: SMC-Scp complex subunit ScpB [Anaerolineales bacterium]